MVSERAPTCSARPLGETTCGRGSQAQRLTLGRGTPAPTLLLPMSWRRKAVWSHLLSLSLLSPWEKGWGKRLLVCMCVHTGGIRCMGRGRVLPPPWVSLGTVVLPCPGFFPLVSPSLLGPHQAYSHFSRPVVGSLTLVTRSSSTLHPGRAGSCRGGKGEGRTLEKEGGTILEGRL